MQAGLCIPAFTQGKDQLFSIEVEETSAIAIGRIHVERVIGMVQQNSPSYSEQYQLISL